ncbi:CLUMA_CG001194, isoform A [Clunio marinus]|uniref:CLUMA_CG001194, isoform A n=1 Tax=Clunio marinus TaxID=568069 RepID=A0A1J1HH89_9DIPT|nr:CLUMA_CG001194, isoform A [Clunio marinus]
MGQGRLSIFSGYLFPTLRENISDLSRMISVRKMRKKVRMCDLRIQDGFAFSNSRCDQLETIHCKNYRELSSLEENSLRAEFLMMRNIPKIKFYLFKAKFE